jgi:hypothetical protein
MREIYITCVYISLFLFFSDQCSLGARARDFFVGFFFVGVLLVFAGVHAHGSVAVAEGADVVLEGALVLEVRAADAEPELPTVLLVRAPVAAHRERLAALAALEGLDAVLALVVRLQRAEVLEGFGARVVDVVAAPGRAAVARQTQHGRRLRPPQRLRPFPVLRSMAPHVHLPTPHANIMSKQIPVLSRSVESCRITKERVSELRLFSISHALQHFSIECLVPTFLRGNCQY